MKIRKLQIDHLDITTYSGFKSIYDEYSPKVYGFFMDKLRNPELVEDLLQDVFSDIWENRHKIVLKGPLENYLMTVCKYKIIDFNKSRQRAVMLDSANTSKQRSNTTPEDWLIYSELKAKTLSTLKTLPTRTKEVFIKSRLKGLSNGEIAKKLNVSEKTVEYHIGKSLKLLRKNFHTFF